MLEFRSFEDILDFAILQEKAAQQFYAELSGVAADPDVKLFYRTLAEEECVHEKELAGLKRQKYDLAEPTLRMLADSGYLAAMPAKPDMTMPEAIAYALKKEKSAKMLYSLLAKCMKEQDMQNMFLMLAEQEQRHVEFFQKEHAAYQTA